MAIILSFPVLLSAALGLIVPARAQVDDFKAACLAFTPEAYVTNSTRQVLDYVPAGTTLVFNGNDASCARPSQVVAVDICRAALSIPTSNRSSITFEMWLPRNWTGRFLGTGNGGIDGCVRYEDLAYTTANGFAAVGTNNGHNGTTGLAFYNNPDIVKDFADRSLHTSVLVGKKLVKKFYGREHDKAYYIGCSLGGRQGIRSAEKYPDDFNGIVAGAPAVDFNNLISWRASFFPITGAIGSPNFITAPTWSGLIHNEILKQCDGIDGVLDGIVEDPSLCSFRPDTLLCQNGATTNCLNANQVDQLRKIFSDFVGNEGLVYPAMQPGSEIMAVNKLYAGKPFSYSDDWFKYVVYNNPAWVAANFNLTDVDNAEDLNPFNIRTYPADLSGFEHTRGKILIHHGQQDNQITSFNTPRFYKHLAAGMHKSPAEMDEFLRFFRISGMFHCNMGPGAWVVGQGGASSAAGIPFDAEHNVLAAMVQWIENGTPPETLTGTKFVNDTVSLGVQFQRRHCRFPLRNTYIGGDSNSPNSWECRAAADLYP